MSLLVSFLIATLLIAGMILFRMFAERYALRKKLRRDRAGSECEQAECVRGCDIEKADRDPRSASKQNT